MAIQQLDPDVAARIAAGEVVERPASVVKELLENALDAGARAIRIELAGGGLDLIRVVDDGCGMSAEDAALAFARHATSKIARLDDLDRLRTLGFRGEALASIAAVARVTLLTREPTALAGVQVAAEGNTVGEAVPAGAPVGTSVTVRDLFATVPARLKFLKTRSTETSHALRLVEQYALAYPEVRFSVTNDGRQVFASPGDGKLASVLVAVYGLSVAEQMLPLPESESPDQASGSGDERPRVSGYVSRPSCYKSTRHYISLFVNRRWVQSRSISFAVEEAYHSLMLTGRHPVAVISISLDPALIDVNVHPAKTEVKFLHERQVYAAVQRAVRAAVLETAESPQVSSHVFSVPAWERARLERAPARDNPAPAPAAPEPMASTSVPVSPVPAASRSPEPPPAALAQVLFGDEPLAPVESERPITLPGAAPDEPVGGTRLPVLRVLGQVSQSYIITEGPDGVYMVDQHAAHERILLDRMVTEWQARGVSSQLLLQPLVLELAPEERDEVEQHLAALRSIGFEVEPFGEMAMLVRAVPAALTGQRKPQPVQELLLELVGADAEAASHGETWEEHALANVACKAAIKAGQPLSPEEQRELIRQLEQAGAHQSCCHGRPTMVHLSLSALEREFDRR